MTTITHKDYQAHVGRLHDSAYMTSPMEIAIETQTVCNAACEFCPYPSLERIGNKMPDELVAKIIDDMRAFPADMPFIISPFKVNDPLLDVRIFDICAEINRSLPQAMVRMFTNGSPLTPGAIEKIARIERLEHLWISLNHYKPEAYAKVMGAGMKLSRTLSRLDWLHGVKAEGGFAPEVVLSRVNNGTIEDGGFKQYVKIHYPLFRHQGIDRAEWLGHVPGIPARKVLDMGCARWYEMSICSTGIVSLCCMDGKAEFPVGDVNKQTLLQIYNGAAFRKYRETYATRLAGAPCNRCTQC